MIVIFDCDGVLVDSEKIAMRILHKTLEEFIPESKQLSSLLADAPGKQTRAIIAEVATRTGATLPDDIVQRIDTRIYRVLDEALEPIPGVEAVLASILVDKAVVSNSLLSRVEQSLAVTGLDGFNWRGIFSADQVGRPKPAPDLYLYAAERLGVAPEECLVVEDSISGVKAASTAGANVIGFLGAGHVVDGQAGRLRAAGALRIARHMRDLCSMLNEAGNGVICRV